VGNWSQELRAGHDDLAPVGRSAELSYDGSVSLDNVTDKLTAGENKSPQR